MVKGIATSAIKKVTLELIYQVVNERTEELKEEIGEIREKTDKIIAKQEADFRYLVQKIDTDIGGVRSEIGQLRSEIKGEMGQLRSEVKAEIGGIKGDIGQLRSEIGQLRGEMGQLRGEMGQINQRIDTVIQMLVSISQNKPQ